MILTAQKRKVPSEFQPREPLSERDVDFGHEALRDDLHGALRATGYFVSIPCDVTVHVSPAGDVSLCGIVPSYFLKQKAQVAVMSVDGVRSLQNDLVVL